MPKIQFRRGNKNGLPALSPGEPALTLNTSELFIGGQNGNLQIPVLDQDGKVPAGQLPAGDYFTKSKTLQDATAALYGLGADAVPDNLFNVLSKSALYKTVAATQQLGDLPEGSIIYLNEDGAPVPFYVAKQDYEPDYNTDRVLVVRKDAAQTGDWRSTSVNTYDGSAIDAWLNQTYLQFFDSDMQTQIGATNIPATSPRTSGVIRLNKSIFPLSLTEYGFQNSYANIEGTELPIADILKILPIEQWTRTPRVNSTGNVYFITRQGSVSEGAGEYGYRPAFTLPSDFTAYTEEPVTGLYDVLDNLIMTLPATQIVTGSYKGTGTYGENNPTILDLPIDAKILFVECDYQVRNASMSQYPINEMLIIVSGASTALVCKVTNNNDSYTTQNGFAVRVNETGRRYSWDVANFNASAELQMNQSGKTYRYVAIS